MSRSRQAIPDGFVRLGEHVWGRNTELLIPSALVPTLKHEQNTSDDLFDEKPDAPVDEPAADEVVAVPEAIKDDSASRQIFDPDEVAVAIERLKTEDGDVAKRYKVLLQEAQRDGGRRKMPKLGIAQMKESLTNLAEQMPNFEALIAVLRSELSVALSSAPDEFRVSPILMHGEPGIGKTLFAKAFAASLCVCFQPIALATASAGFCLSGSARAWGNSRPGILANVMCYEKSATPVTMLDEVDKISNSSQSPIVPVLLELFEEVSAKRFRDEAMEVRMDLGGVIFIATANDIDAIPKPLMSRLRVVDVRSPSQDERFRIAKSMSKPYEKFGLEFSADALSAMIEQAGDLRELQRIMRDAVGEALYSGWSDVRCPDSVNRNPMKGRIGFV